MSETREQKPKSRKAASGAVVPAGLLIGMGVGFALDNLVAFMFIGLGAGLLAFAIIMLAVRD